jgi:hypothetical protein
MRLARPPAGRAGILIVLGILSVTISQSRASEGKNFSVSLKGSLTTGSQLFPNPNSSDDSLRAAFFSLKDIWGYGIEVRYRFPETDLAIALSADYLRTIQISSSLPGTRIPVEDGYRVIPVELTGYFIIPISGEVLGVYMGGGGGAYFGHRIYRIGNTDAPPIDHDVGFGIHVLSGLSYRFNDIISLNAEMKFRDLQFNSVNQFSSPQVQYGPTLVNVSTKPFESLVHTDGIIFQLGVVIEF